MPPVDPAEKKPDALPENDSSALKQIRTYQGDVADALKQQKESVFSIREKELARDGLLKRELTPEQKASRKRKLITAGLFIFSLVLLTAGGAAAFFSYRAYVAKIAVPPEIIPQNRLIPVENTIDASGATLSKNSLATLISNEKAKPIPIGSVEQIELRLAGGNTAPILSTQDFLNAIGAQAPEQFERALDPLFMIGLLGPSLTETQPSTFIIIRLDSFDNAFTGILDWEPQMPADILSLFADASTTASVFDASSTPFFSDVTIKNKDARVLRGFDGNDLLVYSFFDQNTLIITDSEDDLRTLIGLLTSQELSH